jgi:predicted nuclease of restriction endonuclease-like RecB superfamily
MRVSDDVARLNPGVFESETAPVRVKARQVAERPKFKSKLEERAWKEWVPQQGANLALYEPFMLHLTGGNYTPDFVLLKPDGELWLIEVKGSWRAYASGRSSKRNLRQASIEFAFLGRWFSLMPAGRHGWDFSEVKPA